MGRCKCLAHWHHSFQRPLSSPWPASWVFLILSSLWGSWEGGAAAWWLVCCPRAHQLTVCGGCDLCWQWHPCLLMWQEMLHFSAASRLNDHPMSAEVRGCEACLSFLFWDRWTFQVRSDLQMFQASCSQILLLRQRALLGELFHRTEYMKQMSRLSWWRKEGVWQPWPLRPSLRGLGSSGACSETARFWNQSWGCEKVLVKTWRSTQVNLWWPLLDGGECKSGERSWGLGELLQWSQSWFLFVFPHLFLLVGG